MTVVRSFLLESEKFDRKRMLVDLAELNGRVFSFPAYNATVAIMPEFPGSRMMVVSVSIAEPRETKFKRKVGEYHALRRMFDDCEYIKLPSVFNTWVTDTWDGEPNRMYQDEWAERFVDGFTL